MKKFTIKSESAGQRLDTVLATLLDLSRSQVQKILKAGEVSLNGAAATAHRLVKEGDSVELTMAKAKPSGEKKLTALPEIPIIAETADYIVINKPAGLLMHGTERDGRVSVVAAKIRIAPALFTAWIKMSAASSFSLKRKRLLII